MEGHVDRLRAGILDGWAWDSTQPDEPVCIEIRNADGMLIAVGVADQYRADLLHAGKGNGAHGFSIRLAEHQTNTAFLSVCLLGGEFELVGSPIELNGATQFPNAKLETFSPTNNLENLRSLDDAYGTALVDVSRRLRERKQYVTNELLRLNKKQPGIINTLFNSASKHPPYKKRDIFVFPPIDWDYRYQRPQHFASELASLGHRVFYVAPQFASPASVVPGSVYDAPYPGVFLLKLRCGHPHPEINRNTFTPSQVSDLTESLNAVIDDLAVDSPAMIIQNPVWCAIKTDCRDTHVIYDCIDLISGFEATSQAMLDAEKEIIASADMVLASSSQLIEYVKSHQPKLEPVLVRNAATDGFFHTPLSRDAHLRPRIGYLGAIEKWFDSALVKEIAIRHPEWDVVLAGHPLPKIKRELEAISNILFLGEVTAAQTPSVVASFDVALIPFVSEEMTRFVNPVKIYEYLAAGRGVVSCKMPELDQFDTLVVQADGADEFCNQIRRLLEIDNISLRNERRMRVIGETWSMRASQVSNIINLALPFKNHNQ